MTDYILLDGHFVEAYNTDHPVDYCPSCNTTQDVHGIERSDVSHEEFVRETEEATWNHCQRCRHVWVNISRPTPEDYPCSDLDDFARPSPRELIEETVGSIQELFVERDADE